VLAEGATVVVTDINPSSSDERYLDVSDSAQWAALVESLPPFDVVHLNAGITTPGRATAAAALPLSDVTDEAYRSIVGVNLDGVFFGVRAALPGMAANGGGQFLVTASMAGLAGCPAMWPTPPPSTPVGLVRSLGASLDPYGVCISAICPGFVDTAIVPDDAKGSSARWACRSSTRHGWLKRRCTPSAPRPTARSGSCGATSFASNIEAEFGLM
jgi:NAD(P)-dependent dehydrogenase (short-subunit alcohol dehydrogenase family)